MIVNGQPANFKRAYKYSEVEKLILTVQLHLSIEFFRKSGLKVLTSAL